MFPALTTPRSPQPQTLQCGGFGPVQFYRVASCGAKSVMKKAVLARSSSSAGSLCRADTQLQNEG